MKNHIKDEVAKKIFDLLDAEGFNKVEQKRILGSAYGKILKDPEARTSVETPSE